MKRFLSAVWEAVTIGLFWLFYGLIALPHLALMGLIVVGILLALVELLRMFF